MAQMSLARLAGTARFRKLALLTAALAAPLAAHAQSAAPPGVAVSPLPLPDNAASGYASAINANGSIVAGFVNNGQSQQIVLWTNGVPAFHHVPLDFERTAGKFSVSGDGTTVVGVGFNYIDGFGWIWTEQGGQRIIPDVSPNEPIYGPGPISTDGKIVAVSSLVGTRLVAPDGTYLGGTGPTGGGSGYLWSEAGGFRSIGHVSNDPKEIVLINGMSGDAKTVAGNVLRCTDCSGRGFPIYDNYNAFLWKEGSGLTLLPNLAPSIPATTFNPLGLPRSIANNLSRDGLTVIGSSFGSDGREQAVYWRSGQINPLGFLNPADTKSVASLVSGDGSIMLGEGSSQTGGYFWRWTAATGMQDIRSILTNAGFDFGTYEISAINGMSDDGRIILGNWYDPAGNRNVSPILIQLAQITRTQLIVRVQLPEQVLQSVVNQSFSTQVTGTLNGQTLLTRTFADTIDSTAGTQALVAVRAGLSVGALRRVTIGTPYLVSNTTTVTNSTSSTTNVLTGTSTSTATRDAFGPATVITGDLGVCATPATSTALPTGCSLPGTAVNVDIGVFNTNIYTNTIQSITPTTTVTVNQLIAAKWQIDAVGGNQFGTVHALVGPAAFARGNRLAALLLSRGGAGERGAPLGIARATTATRQSSGFDGENGLTVFGGYYNDKSSIDADPAVPVALVKGSSDGLTIGVEKALGGEARLGVAVDYGKVRYQVADPAFPETLDQSLTQIAAYGGWRSGGFSVAASAAYGFGKTKTVVATPAGPASANRNLSAWSLGAETRYAIPLGQGEIGAAVGLRYTAARLNAFTETGGSTPLTGIAKTVSRTRGYAGLDASLPIVLGERTRLTPRLYGRAARDWGDPSGSADVLFASAPAGPVLTAYGPATGKWTAEVGGGLELSVGDNIAIWGGYDAQVNRRSDTRTARAGLSIQF